MNILFIYSSVIDPMKGGVQRVTTVLADAFEQEGHRVRYLATQKAASDTVVSPRQSFLPDFDVVGSPSNVDFLKNLVSGEKIDIVINQDGLNPVVSALAYHVKVSEARLFSVLHNSPLGAIKNYRHSAYARAKRFHLQPLLSLTDFPPVKAVMLWLYRRKYKSHFVSLCETSDKVVLLSEKFKNELAFYFNAQCPKNVVSISNPISFKPSEIGFFNKKKELLFVGRIDFGQKRVDLLLKIWSQLFKEFPDWTLRIVGDGPDFGSAQRLTAKLGLERVLFEGFKDPSPYYKDAAILCMTSSFEGFPLVLVEAASFGCVPVAFNSFLSISDVIDDGVTGSLVAAFDTKAFAASLSALMRDQALRDKMAMSVAKSVRRFSIFNIRNTWMELFGL